MSKIIDFQFPPEKYQLGGIFFHNEYKPSDVKKLLEAYTDNPNQQIIIRVVSLNEGREMFFTGSVKSGCSEPKTIDDFTFKSGRKKSLCLE